MSLFDDVKKNLRELYAVTSEKTTEEARVMTRRYDKFGISRDIERQFSELGSLIYNGLAAGRDDLLADEGVLALVQRITDLEAELQAKKEEIDRIRSERASRKAEAEAEASGGASATVITDPVLHEGREESAILVEPGDAESESTGAAGKAAGKAAEKDG